MSEHNHITDDILASYLAGELPAAQQAGVQAWIAASRANKDHFDELRLIWKESGKLAVHTTVTTEEAWNRFRNNIGNQKPVKKVWPLRQVAGIAAALLLLAGGWWLAASRQGAVQGPATVVQQSGTPAIPAPVAERQTPVAAAPTPVQEAAVAAVKHKPALKLGHMPVPVNYHRTKEFVCNATPCPLEICIVQTVRCDNGAFKKVATCNVLQPDQAGQLHYKAFDKVAGNCDATVAEIRIKRVSTGETIVLNKETQPATVEEIFDYLTGVKKEQVDILAGVFETDCDNSCNQHRLKIGSDPSHLILQ